jgi:hypothetical protein
VARSTGLVIRELPGETVVYDRESHRAHCLNATASLVFGHCDGRRTIEELADLLGTDEPATRIEAARNTVAALLEAGLLQPGTPAPPSRRETLRRVGLGAALLVPAVTSLLVPTPAEAAATCIPIGACTNANIGQPCYTSNPGQDCLTKTCQGTTTCTSY